VTAQGEETVSGPYLQGMLMRDRLDITRMS
jgi:hypothetical protein